MIFNVEIGENMETNIKKTKLRKYTYAYVTYKDLGNMFLSFVADLVVMLLPIAIWDAVMIGIFGYKRNENERDQKHCKAYESKLISKQIHSCLQGRKIGKLKHHILNAFNRLNSYIKRSDGLIVARYTREFIALPKVILENLKG